MKKREIKNKEVLDNLKNTAINQDYELGFHIETKPEINLGKGLNKEIIKKISESKKEPEWMLELRLKAFEKFLELTNPKWGPDLNFIDFQDFKYYIKSSKLTDSWDEVPLEIKTVFEKIGIPEAERSYLAGVTTQFESEAVYLKIKKDLEAKGVIYLDTDTGLHLYPEIFKEYFGKIIKYDDNKYAALNTAVWSGGSFIYVPKNVEIKEPLQSYFRMNESGFGQFERTLIICEDYSYLNYVEGCTAPLYSKDSLHAAVVEIFVKSNAKCRYTTIQNWSKNILNLVTQRAYVDSFGEMEWIDGNMGSRINMKYPSTILAGPYAKGKALSIAIASEGQDQDTGAKMIHLAPNTSSTIVSKSVAKNGGIVDYRGKVYFSKQAHSAFSHIECDTILMDEVSKSDTTPINIVNNSDSFLEHEAKVSKISEEQLFYLMSRGIDEKKATELIIMGFIDPFSKELPMEYSVELNKLIILEMKGSIG